MDRILEELQAKGRRWRGHERFKTRGLLLSSRAQAASTVLCYVQTMNEMLLRAPTSKANHPHSPIRFSGCTRSFCDPHRGSLESCSLAYTFILQFSSVRAHSLLLPRHHQQNPCVPQNTVFQLCTTDAPLIRDSAI